MNSLKVYRVSEDSDLRSHRFLDQHHSLPFILEGSHFNFVTSVEESDIVVILSDTGDLEFQRDFIQRHYGGQLILVLHIFHSEENFSAQSVLNRYVEVFDFTTRLKIVHTELNFQGGIYYDWLWNRQKMLFTDYTTYRLESYNYMDRASKKMYQLGEIVPKTWGCRKFLCINRIRKDDFTDRNVRRIFLREYLKLKDGYINDPENNIKYISQESVPYYTHTLSSVTTDFHLDAGFGKVHPIHDIYYQDTVFSIYVETLTYFGQERMRTITEKTWNPLIKGHYILPYGYCGMIKDIRGYGFMLPDWIDYSYDSIENDSIRFMKYIESINKLLDLSNQQLITLNDNGLDMLRYNRRLFFKRDYHSLYSSVVKEFTDRE